jgi:hypothetical protein
MLRLHLPHEHAPILELRRLGVQPVEQAAYDAVVLLGTQGGWEDIVPGRKAKSKSEGRAEEEKPAKRKVSMREDVTPNGKKIARVVKAEDLPKVQGERRSMRGKG